MKKCLIVVNAYKDECKDYAEIIRQYLDSRKIQCSIFLFSDANNVCSFTGNSFCITFSINFTQIFYF